MWLLNHPSNRHSSLESVSVGLGRGNYRSMLATYSKECGVSFSRVANTATIHYEFIVNDLWKEAGKNLSFVAASSASSV